MVKNPSLMSSRECNTPRLTTKQFLDQMREKPNWTFSSIIILSLENLQIQNKVKMKLQIIHVLSDKICSQFVM